MHDLVTQGKILYWGVSEWSVEQMLEVTSLCRTLSLHQPTSNQPRYSLLWRYPERSVFPFCEAEGIGQVVFSPLAHGVLSGKYAVNQPPPADTRAADPAKNQIMMRQYFSPEKLAKVTQMATLAQQIGISSSQLALAWTLRRNIVSSVITGATKIAQVSENARAAEIKLDDELATALEEIFPIPQKAEEMA